MREREEVPGPVATRRPRSTTDLATLLDHLPDALLLIDSAGGVVNANARALAAFRAGPDVPPLVGRRVAEVLPGFAHGSGRPTRRSHGTPSASGPERQIAHALDGTTFPVDVTRALVPWGEGGRQHLMLVLHEAVEAPVHAELFRTSQQAQAVLRATEEAVCGIDRDGRIVLANPAAARMLGAHVGEIAGRDLHGLSLHTRLDGTPYPAEETPVAETLRTGRRQQHRREIVWRVDGSPVPVEISTAAIKEGTEVVGAVAAISDVTRLTELDRRRRRLLDLLDGEVAPTLADLAGGGTPDPAVLARLRTLVADAVDYESLMGNQVKLQLVPTDVDRLVREATASAAPLARRRGVRVDVLTERASVRADGRRLALAIAELVRAAVHASVAGASVAVTAAGSGDGVRVMVRETRVADRARENPLLRWLRPRRRGEQSSDPDLAFVQVLAERHGGRFLLEPAENGTRSYILELPRAADAAAVAPATPAAETPAAPGGRRRRHARPGELPEPEPAGPVPGAADPRDTAGDVPADAGVAGRARPPLAAAPNEPASVATGGASARVDPRTGLPAPLRPVIPNGRSATADGPPPDAFPPPSPAATTPGPGTRRRREPGSGSDTGLKLLLWPGAPESLERAIVDRGWAPRSVTGPQEVGGDSAAALLVDPFAGPVSRRSLVELRSAAEAARVPLFVIAGLAEAIGEDGAGHAAPSVLLGALRGSANGDARVLLIEEDPALATALGADLLRRRMSPVYARSDAEAMLRARISPPDLVLANLETAPRSRAGIVDWLRNAGRLAATPIVAYTAGGLAAGHQVRLERGETRLSVAARGDGAALESRLLDLVVRAADP